MSSNMTIEEIQEMIQKEELLNKLITLRKKNKLLLDNEYEENKTMSHEVLINQRCENIRLLVRLPQSGKTRIMFECIEEFMREHTKTLVLVLTDNSTLLCTQTRTRGGEICSIKVGQISSTSEGYCAWNKIQDKKGIAKDTPKGSSGKTLEQRISTGEVNTLMMCSNTTRWNDIDFIINNYSQSHHIQIWIDEADKTVGGIDNSDKGSLRRINQLNKWKELTSSINLITATPFSPQKQYTDFKWIGKNFGDIMELVKIPEIVGDGYHHLCESHYTEQDDTFCNPAKYAKYYLDSNPPENGNIFLIPGTVKVKSHDEVKNMCLQNSLFDFVVVLNGKAKGIRGNKDDEEFIVFDNTKSEIKKIITKQEVAKWFSTWYTDYDGKNKKVAITGNLCISRGITISSMVCQISHMIFGGGGKIREEEQLLSRVCGYCYLAEKKPIVVCSRQIWNDVSNYQNIVIEMSQMAMSDGRVLTHDKLNHIFQKHNNMCNFTRAHKIHTNKAENDEYAKEHGRKKITHFNNKNANGFKLCSTSKVKVHSLDEIIKLANSPNKGSNMDINISIMKKGDKTCRTYVCYEDITDITTERFVSIWVERIK